MVLDFFMDDGNLLDFELIHVSLLVEIYCFITNRACMDNVEACLCPMPFCVQNHSVWVDFIPVTCAQRVPQTGIQMYTGFGARHKGPTCKYQMFQTLGLFSTLFSAPGVGNQKELHSCQLAYRRSMKIVEILILFCNTISLTLFAIL